MTERHPDIIDREMLETLHSVGMSAVSAGRALQSAGDQAAAERYARVGRMLIGAARRIRDPLLVALWERAGNGNPRFSWTTEEERRHVAVAAVYLLMKYDAQKTARACKTVAAATGESAETLRVRFKGKVLRDFETETTEGAYVWHILMAMQERFAPAKPHWRDIYESLIKVASDLSKDIAADTRRVRENWLNPEGD